MTKLDSLIRGATEIAQANEAAVRDVQTATAELLASIAASVPTTLRTAIGTRPVLASANYILSTGRPTKSTEQRAPWRGIHVAGVDEPRAERSDPEAFDGQYLGRGLWLADDGHWYDLAYSGDWSAWAGSACKWHAHVRIVSAVEIAAEWPDTAEDVAVALASALDRYATGRASKRAQTLRTRAERLRAAMTLLAS